MEKIDKGKTFKLKFSFNIINDSYVKGVLNNTFIVFETFNNLSYLIYSSKYALINCYDIINFQKICEIKDDVVNSCNYVNFNHYSDKKNKRDLVISIYCKWDTLKIWNVNNWECLLILSNINNGSALGCCCFLETKNKNELYIITSCRNNKNNLEPIKVFNLEGKKINDIKNSSYGSMYIESFYDNKYNKNYIFSCNMNCVRSYDFQEKSIYHEYFDKKENELYNHALVYEYENKLTLISTCFQGSIRFWDFHNNILIKKINITPPMIFECGIWDDEYLFVGSDALKLINLKNGEIKYFEDHKNTVVNIKIIKQRDYGKCVISQGIGYNKIILWIFDDKN